MKNNMFKGMYGKVCILKKVWFFSSLFIILIYPHFVCFLHVRVVYNVTKVGCLQKISSFFDLRVSTMLFTRVRRPCPPRPPHPLSPSLPYRVTSRPRLGPLPPCGRAIVSTNELHRSKVFFFSSFFFVAVLFFSKSFDVARFIFTRVFRYCCTQQGLFLLPFSIPLVVSLSIFFIFPFPLFSGCRLEWRWWEVDLLRLGCVVFYSFTIFQRDLAGEEGKIMKERL